MYDEEDNMHGFVIGGEDGYVTMIGFDKEEEEERLLISESMIVDLMAVFDGK